MASSSMMKWLQRKGRSTLEKLEYILEVSQAYENLIHNMYSWVIVYILGKRALIGCHSSAKTLMGQTLYQSSFLYQGMPFSVGASWLGTGH